MVPSRGHRLYGMSVARQLENRGAPRISLHRSTDHLHFVPSCTPRDRTRERTLWWLTASVLTSSNAYAYRLIPATRYSSANEALASLRPSFAKDEWSAALPLAALATTTWSLRFRRGRVGTCDAFKALMQGVPCSGTIGWRVALTDSSTQSRFLTRWTSRARPPRW